MTSLYNGSERRQKLLDTHFQSFSPATLRFQCERTSIKFYLWNFLIHHMERDLQVFCSLTSVASLSRQWCYHIGQLLRGPTLYARKSASGKLLVLAQIRPIRRKKKDENPCIQLPFVPHTRGRPSSCTILVRYHIDSCSLHPGLEAFGSVPAI